MTHPADLYSKDFKDFQTGYLDALMWASTVSNDADPDSHDSPNEYGETSALDLSARLSHDQTFMADLRDFFKKGEVLMSILIAKGECEHWSQHGHDFYLTREHHGAGFWDRGYSSDLGDRLTDLAHEFGDSGLELFTIEDARNAYNFQKIDYSIQLRTPYRASTDTLRGMDSESCERVLWGLIGAVCAEVGEAKTGELLEVALEVSRRNTPSI